MLIFAALNGKVFLVRKIRGPDRGHVYAMKVSICPVFVLDATYREIFLTGPPPHPLYESQYYFRFVPSSIFMQVLKKSAIVGKKKSTEHKRTERQVFNHSSSFMKALGNLTIFY